MREHTVKVLDNGNKVVEITEQVHTRKLDRAAAKYLMKRKGITKLCHHGHSGDGHRRSRNNSYFSQHWREYNVN